MSSARSTARLLCLLIGVASASGCALPAFIHDKTIGPISPAGHVHTATVGGEFDVSDDGVQARSRAEWWFRPYPENFIARMGRPQTFWFMAKGMQAFFYGLSPLVIREHEQGIEPPPEALADLREASAASSQDVLDRLGPPSLWLRRRTGSVMAYRADKSQLIAFWIGTPPFVDIIPGANNLSFRYLYRRAKPFKTILFFDADERLLGLVDNSARMRGEDEDEEVAE